MLQPRCGAMSSSVGATWSSEKAIKAGLKIRSIDDTVGATLDWFATLPQDRQNALRSGIALDKEKEVLAAWKAAQDS